MLLGAIIEKDSGKTYETFLTESIFNPLGMTNTHYGSNEPIIPGRGQGYTGRDHPRNAQYLSMTQPYSAGALVSAVDDLARWDAALYTETLLKQASLERMWTPYTLPNGKLTDYGYGWWIAKLRGRRSIEHGGGIPGFVCFALRLPEDKVYVAVLCNSDSPKVGPDYVARRVAALAIGRPFPEFIAVRLDPQVLARHMGVYEKDKENRWTVTVENDKLYIGPAGGWRLEAIPSSETEFFFQNNLTHLRLERDASGKTSAMLVYKDGADEPERAVRVEETVTPSA